MSKLITQTTHDLAKANNKSSTQTTTKKDYSIPKDWEKPSISISIPEVHMRRLAHDPAAESEIVKAFLAGGFTVHDLDISKTKSNDEPNTLTPLELAKQKNADIMIKGEAFAELGSTLGAFEGTRARVEIKVVDVRNNTIIYTDSAYGVATDLAESTAGKKAIQQATNKLIPKLVYETARIWNDRK